MRILILSDIHANYEALSAVLESYTHEDITEYYCLGDTVGYGGSPNECADVVRELAKATILGTATVDGSGSHLYEIDVTDNGQSGANDKYRILIPDIAYDSGEHTLGGGNITIH